MNVFDTVMDFTDNEYPVTEGIGNSFKKIMAFFKKTFQRFVAFVKSFIKRIKAFFTRNKKVDSDTKNKASKTVKDLDAATKKAKDINDKLVNSDYDDTEVVSGEVVEDAVKSMNSSVMSAKEFDEVMKKKEGEIKKSEKDLEDKKRQFANNHDQRMNEIRKAYQNVMSNNIKEDEYDPDTMKQLDKYDLDVMKQLDEISSELDDLLK